MANDISPFKANRLEFHSILVGILGSSNVYYQPPESVKLVYPCIVYSRINIANDYSNDNIYNQNHSYSVTLLTKDPDSDKVDALSHLPYARFDRHFTSDGLNHDVFTVYYK